MGRKIVIVSIVMVAVVVAFALKPSSSSSHRVAPSNAAIAQASSKVLLFADPREAESSCGCAEVIRTARKASNIPGVAFKEFDLRQEEASKYSVRISPTVLFFDQNGTEKLRFEGESGEVISRLQKVVDSLGNHEEK